jgi:hypothetical protein
MSLLRKIKYKIGEKIIDSFNARYSDESLPKRGQTFSKQQIVEGEIKDIRYLIELVCITDSVIECECSIID